MSIVKALAISEEDDLHSSEDTSISSEAIKFEITKERWSNLRQTNVDLFGEIWKDNPRLVKILIDPKLDRCQVAMLRKDAFEELLARVRSMSDMEVDFEILRNNIEALAGYVSEHEELGETLKKLVQAISMSAEKISTAATMRKRRSSRKPPTISPEEIAELEAEEREP